MTIILTFFWQNECKEIVKSLIDYISRKVFYLKEQIEKKQVVWQIQEKRLKVHVKHFKFKLFAISYQQVIPFL